MGANGNCNLGTTTLLDSGWKHFSISFYPTRGVIYLMMQDSSKSTAYSFPCSVQVGVLYWFFNPASPNYRILECASGTCASFKVGIRELRIWDTYRDYASIEYRKGTDLTQQHYTSIIGYWPLKWELSSFGEEIYDYSVNGNEPVSIYSFDFLQW